MLRHTDPSEMSILQNFKPSSNENDPAAHNYHEAVKNVHSKVVERIRQFKKNNKTFKTTVSAIYGTLEVMKKDDSFQYTCYITRQTPKKK